MIRAPVATAAAAAIALAACARDIPRVPPDAATEVARPPIPDGSAPDAADDRTADALAEVPGEAEAADAEPVADTAPAETVDAAAAPPDGPPGIPIENREKGTPPPPDSAEACARRLLDAIRAGDPSLATDFFFPAEAFDLVKDMPEPRSYHRRLVRWFEEDVGAEHDRNPDVADLAFDRFRLGRCDWIARGEEGNLFPYWSCRHSFFWAKSPSGAERRFEIRVLINWGPDWYVTHLGPVRR